MALALVKLALLGMLGVDTMTMRIAEQVLPVASEALAQNAPAQDAAPAANAPADASANTAANASSTPPDGMGIKDWETLKERERQLQARERSLNALEKSLDQRLDEMHKLEASVKKMLEEAKGVRDQKLKHLVDVYSNMKAQQAAKVMETLDENLAVKILSGMRGRQAGEILTYVEPAKAARLSEALTQMQIPFKQ